MEFVFDKRNDYLPMEVKKMIMKAELTAAAAEAEAKVAKAEAETKVVNAEAEAKVAKAEAAAEVLVETSEILRMKLEQSVLRESHYTARGLIEYIENFRMEKNGTLSKVEKWTKFFKSNPKGKLAYSCIISANPMWTKGQASIANRLTSAYQFQSDPHHATAHEIESGAEFTVRKGSSFIQLYNMAECLNSALQLQGKFS